MDAGLPMAPVEAIAGTGSSRPPAGALPASVATELAPTQAIGAVAAGAPARNPPDNAGGGSPNAPVTIGPEAREAIYEATDTRRHGTTQARAALLRRHAYARAHPDGTTRAVDDTHADIQV